MQKIGESERFLLELFRDSGAKTVPELCDSLSITATAVRQKLDRLDAGGLIQRVESRQPRGRPVFCYSISAKGIRALGHNQAELAEVVWEELLSIEDAELRQRLVRRISDRLAERYQPTKQFDVANVVDSAGLRERLDAVATELQNRNMAVSVIPGGDDGLPVVRFSGCPYPDLSEKSHDICEMETQMLSQMAGVPMRLAECKCHTVDGSCTYVPVAD